MTEPTHIVAIAPVWFWPDVAWTAVLGCLFTLPGGTTLERLPDPVDTDPTLARVRLADPYLPAATGHLYRGDMAALTRPGTGARFDSSLDSLPACAHDAARPDPKCLPCLHRQLAARVRDAGLDVVQRGDPNGDQDDQQPGAPDGPAGQAAPAGPPAEGEPVRSGQGGPEQGEPELPAVPRERRRRKKGGQDA